MKSKETWQKTVKAWAKNYEKRLEAKQTDMLACRPTKACTKQNSNSVIRRVALQIQIT